MCKAIKMGIVGLGLIGCLFSNMPHSYAKEESKEATTAEVTSEAAGTEQSSEQAETNGEAPKDGAKEGGIPEVVSQYATGVVRISLYIYLDKDEKQDVRQGTGILIGTGTDNMDGEMSILTDSSFLNLDKNTREIIRRQYGIESDEDIDTGVDLILEMGTRIPLSPKSSGSGYAVLTPEEPLKGMSCLRLGDASSLQIRDHLYVCCYEGEMDLIGGSGVSDLTLTTSECQLAEIRDVELLTNYTAQSGNVGAPVLNKDGYVVGMFVRNAEGVLSIRSIDDIKKMLDTLSIKYLGIIKGNNYNVVTPEIEEELNTILYECEEIATQREQYTEKSIKKLKEAINSALSTVSRVDATSDDYETAIDNLKKYKKKVKKKDYPMHVVQVIFAIVIIWFEYMTLKNKKKIKMLLGETQQGKNKSVKTTNVTPMQVAQAPKQRAVKEKEKQKNNKIKLAQIVRIDTGEINVISSDLLRIGQSTENIDYTIRDNSSISRHHADIQNINGVYYIVDQNSTNHTYLNGEMLAPGQYTKLEDGDIIKLSDLEFRFTI